MRRLAKATILLVDEDEAVLTHLARTLEAEGAHVRTARATADALAQMHEDAPDVLVSELALTAGDGIELIRAVRRDPSLQRIPAIALTSDARFAASVAAEDAGFDRLFVKPAEDELVIAEVARMLEVQRRAAGA